VVSVPARKQLTHSIVAAWPQPWHRASHLYRTVCGIRLQRSAAGATLPAHQTRIIAAPKVNSPFRGSLCSPNSNGYAGHFAVQQVLSFCRRAF